MFSLNNKMSTLGRNVIPKFNIIRDNHFHDLKVKKFIGGLNNSATGELAVVAGGCGNSASGDKSVVAGGQDNSASGDRSFIGGGENNTANGNESVIGGGKNNVTTGSQTFIGSGYGNQATQGGASVLGGFQNIASNYNSTVSGGANNVSSGFESIVSGNGNTASGNWSAVNGGKDNNSSGEYSIVNGGRGNFAQVNYSSASGQFALARSYGQQAFASGSFNSQQGSAQCSKYVLRGISSQNTPANLYLDGSSQEIQVPSVTALNYIAKIVGTGDTGGTIISFILTGYVYKNGGTLVITNNILHSDYLPNFVVPAPTAELVQGSTDSSIVIKVEGLLINQQNFWVACVETVEVQLP